MSIGVANGIIDYKYFQAGNRRILKRREVFPREFRNFGVYRSE